MILTLKENSKIKILFIHRKYIRQADNQSVEFHLNIKKRNLVNLNTPLNYMNESIKGASLTPFETKNAIGQKISIKIDQLPVFSDSIYVFITNQNNEISLQDLQKKDLTVLIKIDHEPYRKVTLPKIDSQDINSLGIISIKIKENWELNTRKKKQLDTNCLNKLSKVTF